MAFRDRADAGERLAEELANLRLEDPVVLGMARGGIPVGFEVARKLEAPLEVIVVRKLGHPRQPELGMGAIAEGGVRVVNERLVEQLGVTGELLDRVAAREATELERRLSTYRGGRRPVSVEGRTAVVVDDGLATGFTALAAVKAVRGRGARRVVVAVPVAPPAPVRALEREADEVVCLEVTEHFFGLSEWYRDFRQVSDAEVVSLLERATTWANVHAPDSAGVRCEVEVPADGHLLPGELVVPRAATGLVVFAHGSGSSRLSPRNLEVAETLHRAGLATLLFDLLTEDESTNRTNVFDISLLASRMEQATCWLREPETASQLAVERLGDLSLGYFGASTGAAAALVASTRPGIEVRAIVSRGGRPDLAGDALGSVEAPTLLVVGGDDRVVLDLNRQAQRELGGEGRLEIVPHATHLFEEPGALEEVARLARDWFADHLG
jgi:putative phosphoribosyl transferase